MASTSRKKQDEKNLKTLRELGALPQNKYCFDCNQRGPTYVNVTIGSFVCTKCSGMLRGLTPPHRVKSISMATFTNEEIELLKNRGNDYCRGIWLGLYENTTLPSDFRDEQSIRDFMVDKYERKRYYLDPAQALKNGYTNHNNNNNNNNIIKNDNKIKPLTKLISDPKPIILNGNNNNILDNKSNNNNSSSSRKRPEVGKKINHVLNGNEFDVNFEKADIFTANNSSINGINGSDGLSTTTTTQPSFANFDDNPVFNNSINNTIDEFSIFDLKFTNSGPVFKQVPLFPKCNMNRWSMPTDTFGNNLNQTINNNNNNKVSVPPSEDKYAALKDLDNALKSKNSVDWNSSGSTGSLYSSSTPTGSMYSSPSPQSSMFGSPCQGQFMNTFQPNQDTHNGFSNPFNNRTGNCNGLNWNNTTTTTTNIIGNGFNNNIQQQPYANPFRDPLNHYNNKMNGFTQNFQPAVFPVVANGTTTWGVNPFKIGTATTTNVNSNNPFL